MRPGTLGVPWEGALWWLPCTCPGRGQLARLRRRGAEYYVEEAREEGLEASPLRQ